VRSVVKVLPLLAVLLLLAQVALASPQRSRARNRAHTARARSIGAPWHGRLERGIELRESQHIRRAGAYASSTHFFGTAELVHLIERAAAVVARRNPGSKLTTGELSKHSGGEIDGHGSHENGRDADLSFYMMDAAGHPYANPYAFAAFRADGHGLGANAGLRFDDARNWDLVSRLVADPEARVQYIFVARALRDRLLNEGRARHAPMSVLARAASVLVQPATGNPHRNHFHVRIYCDPSDRPACVDRAPYHAWYPGVVPPS
jgi:penicillin-insensitive murein endopeptidase